MSQILALDSFPDEQTVRSVISQPPFVTVEGVHNLRDLGGYVAGESRIVRPGYTFRSAALSKISERGKEQLRNLGIKKIFDLRAASEVDILKSTPPTIEGVEIVPVSVASDEVFDLGNIAKQLQLFAADDREAFRVMYISFLKSGGPAFGSVFQHIRDHPDRPCLFHCTAGKDRTGILSMLLLSLLKVSDDDIVKDYSLTTYGLVPALADLGARISAHQVYKDNWEGATIAAKSEPHYMHDLLLIIREQFGGTETYLKVHGGLTDEDLALIRQNATVAKSE